MNQPVIKTIGIVIKTVDYRDYDKVADILTPTGKITVSVKGVKKQNAKMKGAAQLFAYGEFVLYNKSGKYTVTGYQLADSFSVLSEDIIKFACASVILEICNTFGFNEESGEIFLLTLRTLHTLAHENMPPVDALIFYIIKFVSITGFEPSLFECVRCSSNAGNYFSVIEGGLVCDHCAKGEDIHICDGAKADLIRTIEWNSEDMKLLRYSKAAKYDLYRIMLQYISILNDNKMKSIDFLQSMVDLER